MLALEKESNAKLGSEINVHKISQEKYQKQIYTNAATTKLVLTRRKKSQLLVQK